MWLKIHAKQCLRFVVLENYMKNKHACNQFVFHELGRALELQWALLVVIIIYKTVNV